MTQTVDSQHIVLKQGEPVEMFPVSIRYSYPSEIDLMARLAGLASATSMGRLAGGAVYVRVQVPRLRLRASC